MKNFLITENLELKIGNLIIS